MADNISITPGAGKDVATDDVAGAHFQRVKLDGGGDGLSAPIGGDAANGLDVDVTRLPSLPAGANAIGSVTVTGSVAVTGPLTDTELRATAVPVSMDITLASLGSGIIAGITAGVAVSSLPSITVGAALPAGTNAIGKLAANSGVDIGDVDVTSLPATPAGTNLIGKVSAGLDTTNLYDGATALTVARIPISKNGSGANELVAADATKKIRVLAMMLYAVGTANSAYLASAATAIFGGASAAIPLDKTGATGPAGFALAFNLAGWCETAANEALNLYLSAAQYVGGVLVYTKI